MATKKDNDKPTPIDDDQGMMLSKKRWVDRVGWIGTSVMEE